MRGSSVSGWTRTFPARSCDCGCRTRARGWCCVRCFLARPRATRFSEYRIGLDHIAIAATREEVSRLTEQLRAAGLAADLHRNRGSEHVIVTFRDPDNIQWEFFEEDVS